MDILYYISIYLIVGTAIMLTLDFLHRMVKDQVDEEFRDGYENWERIYIILTWPIFTLSIIRGIIKDKQR